MKAVTGRSAGCSKHSAIASGNFRGLRFGPIALGELAPGRVAPTLGAGTCARSKGIGLDGSLTRPARSGRHDGERASLGAT